MSLGRFSEPFIPNSLLVWTSDYNGLWFAVPLDDAKHVFGCAGRSPFIRAMVEQLRDISRVAIEHRQLWCIIDIVYLSINPPRQAFYLAMSCSNSSLLRQQQELTGCPQRLIKPSLSTDIAQYFATQHLTRKNARTANSGN